MKVRKALALPGPNVWGVSPVLEVWLDIGPNGGWTAERAARVARQVVAIARPYLSGEDCRLPAPQERAEVVVAGWIEQLTRRVQSLCGVELPPGRIEPTGEPGVCRVAIRYEDEGLARPALEIARALLEAAANEQAFDFAGPLRAMQALANDLCLGPSTRAIVEAARARGIPVRRLNVESLVQFGHGSQQRRICTAETDGTGAIAQSIAQDKELTKALLRRVGIPVPKGRPVSSPADAWEAACEIGIPVVVKPSDANHGRGVGIKLSLRERIMAAYEHAAAEGDGVLVEQWVSGVEHRLLVVGNRVVAVSRGEPEQVVGDGVHTIAQLIDLVNQDPRRGDEYARPMCKVKLDPIALHLLQQQGYEPLSVPAPAATVIIHRNGEYTTDVTDQLHPDVAARAVLAARMVGLDVAGIDLMVHDIGRPLEEQGGAIIEVNAGPGLQMHCEPQKGRPRPVGAAIVDSLFPAGQTGRIPIVALTAGLFSGIAAQIAAHLLRQSGLTVGMSCAAGTFVGDRRIPGNRFQAPRAAELFLNPLVDAAVIEITPTAVYEEGLAFDDCDVAVIERAAELDAAATGVHAPDAWRRILIESTSPLGTAVIDADDPHAAQLSALCRGSVMFCHPREDHPLLVQQRATDGKAAFMRGDTLWVARGAKQFPAVRLPDGCTAPVEALLAGVAAAWAAGAPVDLLGAALESFSELPAAGDKAEPCPDQPRAA